MYVRYYNGNRHIQCTLFDIPVIYILVYYKNGAMDHVCTSLFFSVYHEVCILKMKYDNIYS